MSQSNQTVEGIEDDDAAFADYLGAREAALNAAVGYLIADNIPAKHLTYIEEHTTNEIISIAAQIVLHKVKS